MRSFLRVGAPINAMHLIIMRNYAHAQCNYMQIRIVHVHVIRVRKSVRKAYV